VSNTVLTFVQQPSNAGTLLLCCSESGRTGIEFPLVLATVAIVIGFVGPGTHSLDTILGTALPRPETFMYGLLIVIAADILAIASGRLTAEPTSQQEQHT
jgi:hypothetical protein